MFRKLWRFLTFMGIIGVIVYLAWLTWNYLAPIAWVVVVLLLPVFTIASIRAIVRKKSSETATPGKSLFRRIWRYLIFIGSISLVVCLGWLTWHYLVSVASVVVALLFPVCTIAFIQTKVRKKSSETATVVVSQPLDFRRIPAGTRIAGRYRVCNKLGDGAFGTVYRATKESLKRDVALKFLDPHADSRLRSDPTHIREAILAAQVDNPNIVRVNDAGVERGIPYIEMEFVSGESAAAALSRKGKLPPREALRIILQALVGLEAGWRKGVIHRDVKPENLLLSVDGCVKLADFGLAKWTGTGGDSVTSVAGVKGSPAYIAPELWTGKPASVQTDIYALVRRYTRCLLAARPSGQRA